MEQERSTWLTVEKVAKVLLWVVYAWVVVDLVLLLLAFSLRLLGANPDAEFVEWVYRSVERTMAPFRGIFEPLVISDDAVLDTSLLFAMIIYSLVALFLRSAIDWVTAHIAEQRRRAAIAAAGTGPTYPATTPPGQAPPTR